MSSNLRTVVELHDRDSLADFALMFPLRSLFIRHRTKITLPIEYLELVSNVKGFPDEVEFGERHWWKNVADLFEGLDGLLDLLLGD